MTRVAPASCDPIGHRAGSEAPDPPWRSETAREHLTTEVPRAHPGDLAGHVLDSLRGKAFRPFDTVYLVDEAGHLIGTARTADLLAVDRSVAVRHIAVGVPLAVPAETDQERLASLAYHHGISSVPVVGGDGRFLGIVPPETLMGIMRKEHVEDLHRLAGIRRETAKARHALEEPPTRRVHDRLPWLLIGLLGSGVATFAMSRFEAQLEATLTLAYFIPGIVYLADAVGTQTETVVVRGLSLTTVPPRVLLAREFRTGMLIGLILGSLAFALVALTFGDLRLALTIALAVLITGTAASSLGLAFPYALQRVGIDPAFGSGPLATVLQDIVSIVVYFVLAMWILG